MPLRIGTVLRSDQVTTARTHLVAEDARVARQLSERWAGRIINACGQLTFGQFAAALPRCNLFITGDSGPMHVAIAQGVPTVSLWGPTNPGFHAPPGNHCRVIYHQMHCSPCLPMLTSRPGMWCDHRADCMRKITVTEVAQAVMEALDGVAGGRG